MSIPKNITKEHLINAISKVDKEGIPKGSESQYYDVVYNNTKYPPKLIVSFANIYANGIELERNSFAGGKGSPCFELLKNEGFTINKKVDMQNIKLYDIHGVSTIENYRNLITPDNKYFYWDSKRFTRNEIGDVVFWINRTERVALYTKIDSKQISPRFKDGKNLISDNGYNVSASAQDAAQFEIFYRFKIIEKISIPDGWNYSNQVPFNGHTMAIILYELNFKEPEKKIEKIKDLISIFKYKEEILELLNEALLLLSEDKNIIKNTIMEKFREYMYKVHKNKTTSDGYMKMMPTIEAWFINNGLVDKKFKLWDNINEINSINQKLNTTFKKKWKELNKKESNWYSSPWNLWTKFNNKNIATNEDNSFEEILCAIKTKPFILLAGISGTGKSRLVRTLAYKTCAKQGLRENLNKPGNFELIPVRPNWHDSSELMGYISRINGEKYINTTFLKFIAKA